MPGLLKRIVSCVYHNSKKGMACFSLFLYSNPKVFPDASLQGWKCCVLVILSAIIFGSCSSLMQTRIPAQTWTNPREIITAYNDSIEKLQTFKGKGILLIQTTDTNEQGTAHITIKMPDSLHIRIEGPLGIDVASFFMDKNTYLLYLHRDKIVYNGNVDSLDAPGLLYELAGVRIAEATFNRRDFLHELLSFFTGTTVLNVNSLEPIAFLENGKNEALFRHTGTQFQTQFEFPGDRELLQRVSISDHTSDMRVEKTFNRYIKQQGVIIPRRIRFTFFREKARIALQYRTIQINKRIQSNEFTINVPPELMSGLQVMEIIHSTHSVLR